MDEDDGKVKRIFKISYDGESEKDPILFKFDYPGNGSFVIPILYNKTLYELAVALSKAIELTEIRFFKNSKWVILSTHLEDFLHELEEGKQIVALLNDYEYFVDYNNHFKEAGNTLMRKNRVEEALKKYKLSRKYYPKDLEVFFYISKCYRKRKEPKMAILYLNKFEKMYKELTVSEQTDYDSFRSENIFRWRGTLYQQIGFEYMTNITEDGEVSEHAYMIEDNILKEEEIQAEELEIEENGESEDDNILNSHNSLVTLGCYRKAIENFKEMKKKHHSAKSISKFEMCLNMFTVLRRKPPVCPFCRKEPIRGQLKKIPQHPQSLLDSIQEMVDKEQEEDDLETDNNQPSGEDDEDNMNAIMNFNQIKGEMIYCCGECSSKFDFLDNMFVNRIWTHVVDDPHSFVKIHIDNNWLYQFVASVHLRIIASVNLTSFLIDDNSSFATTFSSLKRTFETIQLEGKCIEETRDVKCYLLAEPTDHSWSHRKKWCFSDCYFGDAGEDTFVLTKFGILYLVTVVSESAGSSSYWEEETQVRENDRNWQFTIRKDEERKRESPDMIKCYFDQASEYE